MYKPLVSIVIPVFNGADFMREAIESALGQTYRNIEVIVVNDGSVDDGTTESIAGSYGHAIRYLLKSNGGCASALNAGISIMRGEWFSWLSHDDVYLPQKIEREIDCITTHRLNPESTVVSCGSTLIDAQGARIPRPSRFQSGSLNPEESLGWLLSGRTPNGCGLLIPRHALDRVGGFDEGLTYVLDWHYWLRLALKGCSYYRIPDRLVLNRRHGGQVSVRAQELLQSETLQITSQLADLVESDPIRLRHLAEHAWSYCYRIRDDSTAARIDQAVTAAGFGIRRLTKITGAQRRIRRDLRQRLRSVL